MMSTFSLNFLISGVYYNSWGDFSHPGLVNFGDPNSDDQQQPNYNILHFPFFILVAIAGTRYIAFVLSLSLEIVILSDLISYIWVSIQNRWAIWFSVYCVELTTGEMENVLESK